MNIPRKNRGVLLVKVASLGILLLAAGRSAQSQSREFRSDQWQVAGQNLDNSRSQPGEHSIGPANVKDLKPKWVFTTGSDVSATPTVDGDTVYFPDWAGSLFAVEKGSGHLLWSHKISEYDGVEGAVSRVSPAVDKNHVILGDILNSKLVHKGANVVSVDRETGTLQWITQVETHPAAIITGSPVVFDGIVYVGVSSNEETLAEDAAYPCCSFRGSIVALDEKSGAMLWKTFDMPENSGRTGGYSGGAIWQPPVIDPKRHMIFVGTGNNYSAPAAVEACQNATPMANCAAPDDLFDAALALDLKTGQIKWSKRLQGLDTWTVACLTPTGPKSNCPVPGSPDFDLGGSGPNLVGNIVGFGQKSGIYWALNPDNGDIVWCTPVGAGGSLGGIEWGTATDGKRIYVAIADNHQVPYTLISGQQITWGSWSALDVDTGKILWQTADPTVNTIDTGSVSVANGVLYAGSYSGQMYAMDARTGQVLWNFASGGSVIGGPSIVDGTLYWGSGYRNIPPGIGNNKVYAFDLAGGKDRGDNPGHDHDHDHSGDHGKQK